MAESRDILKLVSNVVDENGKIITDYTKRMDIFTGNIYYRFEDKKMYLLVVKYRVNGTGSEFVKFPGGISDEEKNETIQETCIRESQEETGFSPILSWSELIYSKYSSFTQSGDRTNCEHYKTFFLHHKKSGSLRSAKESDRGENSPAMWMAVEDVCKRIHHGHWQACKNALGRICQMFEGKSLETKTACYFAKLAAEERNKHMEDFYASKKKNY